MRTVTKHRPCLSTILTCWWNFENANLLKPTLTRYIMVTLTLPLWSHINININTIVQAQLVCHFVSLYLLYITLIIPESMYSSCHHIQNLAPLYPYYSNCM